MVATKTALSVVPIGVVHSPLGERVDAPRQPRAAEHIEGTVELFAGCGYEDALSDLASWDHIWLVVWFDRNDGFRPKVAPPRSTQKRGVFATRAPYRPNPIGLSAVRLLSVSGLVLAVQGLDLLDGTPVLDIKPYVPYTDAIPNANHGWLDQQQSSERQTGERPSRDQPLREQLLGEQRPRDPVQPLQVCFSPHASAQLAYLHEAHGVELEQRIAEQLALGAAPHAYRRIRREGTSLRLALKDWRAWFQVQGNVVTVERIGSGYRPRELFAADGNAPAAHRAFVAKWPLSG